MDSTIKAVQTMRAPTVLVLGGSDKHVSFDALAREIIASGQIKCVVLCGATAPQIESALLAAGYTAIEHAEKYPEMVALCRRLAVPGGNVLCRLPARPSINSAITSSAGAYSSNW